MELNMYYVSCKFLVGDDVIIHNDEILASSPFRALSKLDDKLVEYYSSLGLDFTYIGFDVDLS